MPSSTQGVTAAANSIPQQWNVEAGDAVKANIVLADLVDRSFERDLGAKKGNAVNISDWSHPAVRVKTEGTAGTLSNIAETKQTITVNRQAYVAMEVEDVAELQSKAAVRMKYMQDAGYSLAAFVDGDATSGLVSLASGFSQVVGSLGSDPSDDDFLRAVQYLDDANVPEDGRFFAATPAIYNSLLKMNKFTSADFVGDAAAATAVQKARVGMVYNAPVYKSSLLNANPSAANQGYGWFCHKRGTALIMQQAARTDMQRALLDIADAFTVNVIYQFAERLIAPADLGGGSSVDTHNVAIAGA